MDLQTLLKITQEIANKKADGHFTILKFTTNWKVMLGTPAMSMPQMMTIMDHITEAKTLEDALFNFILLHGGTNG